MKKNWQGIFRSLCKVVLLASEKICILVLDKIV
jgi:hypothetical protein